MHKPKWFSAKHVMVSNAPTCGLTKGGRLLHKVDPATALRVQQLDPETGAMVDTVNDLLLEDMEALANQAGPLELGTSRITETLSFIPTAEVDVGCAVPAYYDRQYTESFHTEMTKPEYSQFTTKTIGDLLSEGRIEVRGGHGSPSQEQRIGEVPYIKVSDLRAGFVNINPTNRVPLSVAETFWRGKHSGLQAFDLICPERTSKNIGDFCMLMPGQERILTTKEMIVLRAKPKAGFDNFYLLWALTLKVVRDQWRRIVFMQTNREDVGKRYLEIEIPIPHDAKLASQVSGPFRTYYEQLAAARSELQGYLQSGGSHHFFVAGSADVSDTMDDAEL